MGSGSGTSCSITLNTKLTAEQRERYQNQDVIGKILRECGTVALVGLSSDTQKASYFVASYLAYEGYDIVPVNPRGGEILGKKVWADLEEIPFHVDLVVAFRPAEECEQLSVKAVKIGAKAFWMQLRIVNFKAADYALGAGLDVIMDKCVKMEHGRYAGSLHWAGMNTEIVSARKQKRN
ncbi:MAG TPA: CoA-binding protein [Spirochaetota bacterium]|nr:CoA-binding protein [Spirochaetota bacterium]